MPSAYGTTTAMAESHAPKRGATALPRCRSRIPPIPSCATAMVMAWCASRAQSFVFPLSIKE